MSERPRPSIPHDTARQSGLLQVREFARHASEHSREQSNETLAQLIHLATMMHREAYQLKRRSVADDPIQEVYDQILKISDQLTDWGKTVLEFRGSQAAGKSYDGYDLSDIEKQFMKLAIRDNQARIAELLENIQSMPIEKERQKSLWEKMVLVGSLLAVIGGAAIGLRSDVRAEASVAVGELEVGENAQKKKQKKISKRNKNREGAMLRGKGRGRGDRGGIDSRSLLNRRSAGEKHDGGIEGDGEAGEFPAPDIIAEVDHSLFGSIDDPLWVSDISVLKSDGTFEIIDRRIQNLSTGVEATVAMKPMAISAGETLGLFAPLGYTIGEVETHPPLACRINRNDRTVTFPDGGDEIKITYTVKEVVEAPLPLPEAQDTFLWSDTDREFIDELSETKSVSAEELASHFGSFTYVVSSELQDLFDVMPGTLQEKIAGTRLGDCDSLSMYGVSLLNAAGIRAGVASGILESNKKLDAARPHGKLLYEDKNGGNLFETTAHTNAAYVNVEFLEEDFEQLARLAEQMTSITDPYELTQAYDGFGTAVVDILSRDEYAQFKGENSTAAAIGENQGGGRGGLEQLKNILSELEKISYSHPNMSFFLALFGMLFSAVGGTLGYERLVRQAVASSKKEAFNLLLPQIDFSAIDTIEKEKWEHEDIDRQLRIRYDDSDEFEQYFPLEKAMKLSFEEKKKLLSLYAIVKMATAVPYRSFNMVQALMNRRDVVQLLKRAEADGVSFDGVFSLLASYYGDEKIKKEIEKELPERVENILARGKKIAAERFGELEDRGIKITPERFFNQLGIISSLGDGITSQKSKIGSSGEFYEHVEYQPGMDAKHIDWKASAKGDRLYMQKRTIEVEQEQPVYNMHIVIDVVHSTESQLSNLIAFFHYARRHRKEIRIDQIELVARGERIDRIPADLASKMIDPSFGKSGTKYLIEKICRLRIDHQGAFFEKMVQKDKRYPGDPSLPFSGANSQKRKKEDLFFVGVRGINPDAKRLGAVFTFKDDQGLADIFND